MKKRVRKYDEGGVTEGQNANIGDDTRSRAMAWLKRQQEGSPAEEEVAKPVVKRARATDTGDETARMVRRAPARVAEVDRSIPTVSESPAARAEAPSVARRIKNAVFPGGTDWPGQGALSSLGAAGPGVGRVGSAIGNAVGAVGSRLGRAAAAGLRAGRDEANPAAAAARRYADVARMEEEFGKRATEAAAGRRAGPSGWRRFAEGEADVNSPAGFKKGGKVSTASKRADGIAQRGKTRGKYL